WFPVRLRRAQGESADSQRVRGVRDPSCRGEDSRRGQCPGRLKGWGNGAVGQRAARRAFLTEELSRKVFAACRKQAGFALARTEETQAEARKPETERAGVGFGNSLALRGTSRKKLKPEGVGSKGVWAGSCGEEG